jgi:hypothetical protein
VSVASDGDGNLFILDDKTMNVEVVREDGQLVATIPLDFKLSALGGRFFKGIGYNKRDGTIAITSIYFRKIFIVKDTPQMGLDECWLGRDRVITVTDYSH